MSYRKINDAISKIIKTSEVKDDAVPNSSDKIKWRIAMAAFERLNKSIWKRPELSNDSKLSLYRCLIVPITIYASETWVCNAEYRRNLMV